MPEGRARQPRLARWSLGSCISLLSLGMLVLMPACGGMDGVTQSSDESSDVGDEDDGGELCEPVSDTFAAAGGAIELCGARVEIAAGVLDAPTTVAIAVVASPSATLPVDRVLDGRVYEISAVPPLSGEQELTLAVEHGDEEAIRGLGRLRADTAEWEKVAVGEAGGAPFRRLDVERRGLMGIRVPRRMDAAACELYRRRGGWSDRGADGGDDLERTGRWSGNHRALAHRHRGVSFHGLRSGLAGIHGLAERR